MDSRKISETIASLHDALRVIEMATELKQRSDRIRNLLGPGELDELVGNCITTIKHLGAELKNRLSSE